MFKNIDLFLVASDGLILSKSFTPSEPLCFFSAAEVAGLDEASQLCLVDIKTTCDADEGTLSS